jgi:ABC-type Fe3+-hydroxamate transport system substrate-binding protein
MKPQQIHDQTGRFISMPAIPHKIVSLVPSQTELLFDLGLEERIAGVTKFCVHPYEKCRSKVNVGGTKKLHLDRIDHLDPDLIIANKEENSKEDIELLARKYPVWISDIISLEDAYQMIRSIGELTGTVRKADRITTDIKAAFDNITCFPPYRVVYMIWRKPLMAAGKATFINTLLESTGLKNAIEEKRYPEIHDLHALNADLIMLSSEPFPFKEKHIEEIKQIAPSTPAVLVDGEMFSWYGSRLKLFPAYASSISTELKSSQK